jgi:hypothetical protein
MSTNKFGLNSFCMKLIVKCSVTKVPLTVQSLRLFWTAKIRNLMRSVKALESHYNMKDLITTSPIFHYTNLIEMAKNSTPMVPQF